jgi:hypothetical protein
MATPDPRGRAVLRAYRKATQRPGEQREALWSRIEASLDARVQGPSVEPEPGRPPRPRVEPGPVRGGGWTTPVIVAAIAVAAAVVAVLALGSGERRHAASQVVPWAAPHEVEPGEPVEAVRRRVEAGEPSAADPSKTAATTSPRSAVSADQDAVRRDAASAGGEASVPTDATRRDAVPPHADAAGFADVRIDASPPRRPARSGASELSEADAPPTPSSTEVDELRAEMALIREARQALQADRPAGALEVLDTHARAFPEGQMREDRAVLRIEALCAAGKAPQARAEAQQFVRAFPRSAHGERVRATCAEP